jgi:hypothetical protein
VCGARLAIRSLGCNRCGTELSGEFETCEFCALDDDDRALLRVFLASRGNMKELERHLGVSYPTARARFDALLARMGLQRPDADHRLAVLEALARGEVSVDEAAEELGDDLSRS